MATLDKSCGCSMRQQALFHNFQNKSKMNRDMEVKTLSNIVTYSDIQQFQIVSLDLISMLKQSKSATLLQQQSYLKRRPVKQDYFSQLTRISTINDAAIQRWPQKRMPQLVDSHRIDYRKLQINWCTCRHFNAIKLSSIFCPS
ncbi:Hypothetical_protein [Hexamita inflata]|uniref:Hypothetical_protein n=1 Tax=Hexamita inflata TaxID=28002 RepID=A0AA86Q7S7_9EUKA|nr:Hypothetical protein HINF_LOCUS39926 [Hexamita inflata]